MKKASVEDKGNQIGAALGRIASGMFVVTAKKGKQSNGFLASWVQQAAFEPPMVSVSVKKGRPIEGLLEDGKTFAVHVLGTGNKELVRHFGKGFGPDEDAFAGIETTVWDDGTPILKDSLAYLVCKVAGKIEAGDHSVYLGRVVDGAIQDSEGKPSTHLRESGLRY